MFDNPWPGDGTFLGDMANKDHRSAGAFGEGGQFMAGGAHLRDGTGGAFNVICPHLLDRIDDRQQRAFLVQRGQDIAQIGFGGQLHRGVRQAKPLRAHAHLR